MTAKPRAAQSLRRKSPLRKSRLLKNRLQSLLRRSQTPSLLPLQNLHRGQSQR
jgi:hypothetical protein